MELTMDYQKSDFVSWGSDLLEVTTVGFCEGGHV